MRLKTIFNSIYIYIYIYIYQLKEQGPSLKNKQIEGLL